MEFIEGDSLWSIVNDQGLDWNALKVSAHESVSWCHQLATVLAQMHAHHPPIMHRDIKTENVMLSRKLPKSASTSCFSSTSSINPPPAEPSAYAQVTLIDFGLARSLPTPTIHSPPVPGFHTPARSESEAAWSRRLLRLKPFFGLVDSRGSTYSITSSKKLSKRLSIRLATTPVGTPVGLIPSRPPPVEKAVDGYYQPGTSASPRLTINGNEEDKESKANDESRPKAVSHMLPLVKNDSPDSRVEFKPQNELMSVGHAEGSECGDDPHEAGGLTPRKLSHIHPAVNNNRHSSISRMAHFSVFSSYAMTSKKGSLIYMAPEVLMGRPYSQQADVFSFAVTCWEILHRRLIVHMVLDEHFRASSQKKEEAVMEYASAVAAGYRPPLSPHLPLALKELFERCWAANPSLRPDMRTVEEKLEAILKTEDLSPMNQPPSGSNEGGSCSCIIS